MTAQTSTADQGTTADAQSAPATPGAPARPARPSRRRPAPLDPEARERLALHEEAEFPDAPPDSDAGPELRPEREVAQDCACCARLLLLGVEWLRIRNRPDREPNFGRVSKRAELIGRAVGRRLGPTAGNVVEWVGLGADVVSEFVEDSLREPRPPHLQAVES